MRLPMIAAATANLPKATATAYLSLSGRSAFNTSNAFGLTLIPFACTVKRILFMAAEPPGAGKVRKISLALNSAEVAETMKEMTGTETASTEWTGELALEAGDRISLKVDQVGEPATMGIGTTCLVELDVPSDRSLIGGGVSGGNLSGAETRYLHPFGVGPNPVATEGSVRMVVPIKCKMKSFWVRISGTPGTGKSYTVYVRVNRSTDVLGVNLEGTTVAGSTAEDVQLEPGDVIELKAVPSGTPTNRPITAFGIEIDTEGVPCIIHGGGRAEPESTTTNVVAGIDVIGLNAWGTGSAERVGWPPGITIRRLFVERTVAPGEGKSQTYKPQHAGVNTGIEAVIEGAGKTGNDTTHSYETAADSGGTCRLAMFSIRSGEPAVNTGGTFWGFVVEIPQPEEETPAAPHTLMLTGAGQ